MQSRNWNGRKTESQRIRSRPMCSGCSTMQVGRYQEAAQQLEVSLKLHPQNGEGWSTLGSVYNKLDRLPEAAIGPAERD